MFRVVSRHEQVVHAGFVRKGSYFGWKLAKPYNRGLWFSGCGFAASLKTYSASYSFHFHGFF
jgi:hypothetical protein